MKLAASGAGTLVRRRPASLTMRSISARRAAGTLPSMAVVVSSVGLFEVFDGCCEEARGVAAGDAAMIEAERERHAQVRLDAAHDRNDVVLQAPGAENGDGRRHDERCCIAPGDGAEIRQQ